MREYLHRGMLIVLMSIISTSIYAIEETERIFTIFNSSNGLADNSAQVIVCTKTGRLTISTIGHINFYDGSVFSHINSEREDYYPLRNYSGNYHLYFDHHHHLWLKNTHSVTCVDLLRERFITDIESVFREMGLKENISDIFVDSDGAFWVLSAGSLYCAEKSKAVPLQSSENLQDVDVYKENLLLLFYGNGEVEGYDLSAGRAQFRRAAYSLAIADRYSASSVIKPYKNFYYQIRNGEKEAVLMSFNVETGEWKQLMASPYHLNNLVIHNDIIYMASEYGYWTYDIKTEALNHYEELTLVDGRKLNTDINTIEFDKQGGMWIGTEKRGLLYSKPFQTPFRSFSWNQPEAAQYASMLDNFRPETLFREKEYNQVLKDSRGWTWVGTYTGLQLYKKKDGKPELINHKDGLRNEVVHSIVEDNSHHIWVSTSHGIFCLTIKDGKVGHIETYNEHDNVPNESFVNGRAMKLSDGTIVMQTLDHVMTFNPDHMHLQQISDMKLYPKLIKLLVNGRNVVAGTTMDGVQILERAITRTREINVNYDQNSIVLTFSGLNYFRPVQTYYRYRVIGIDKDWHVLSYYNSDGLVDARGMLHLPLVGMRPGKYTIELQASMMPDKWNVDPYSWIINVNEPWYRTTGVYLLLALVLVGLLLLNFVWYNKNMELRLRQKTEEGDIIRRLNSYVARMETSPAGDMAADDGTDDGMSEHDRELADTMQQKIVPFVRANSGRSYTLAEMSLHTGLNMETMMDAIAANLYKNLQRK